MRIPNTLEKQIDKLYELQREVTAAKLTLKESIEARMLQKAEENYERLEQAIIGSHNIEVLKGTVGKHAKLIVGERINYQIGDWESFREYVVKNNAYDLFQRRITVEAVADREADGVTIPGLDKYTNITIKLKQI